VGGAMGWWWHYRGQSGAANGGIVQTLADAPRAGDDCPFCGGKLTKVGSVTDDRSKPSRNVAVWNRSICGNMFYNNDSIICTKCWQAHPYFLPYWERSSEAADSFRRPLAADIRQFPVPGAPDAKSSIIYSQKRQRAQVIESLSFWCADSPALLANVRNYAQYHGLSVRTEQQGRIPNQVFVSVDAKPATARNEQDGRQQPAIR
jgi:hypothetical protein